MKFRILGPLEVFDGTAWRTVRAAKWRSLLAVLLVNARQVVSIDRIAQELWADDPPATMTNVIHGYIARLRGLLADRDGQLLVTRAPGYLLAAADGDIDTDEFASLTRAGRYSEALALWRGPAFADVPVTPMVREAATWLNEQRLVAVETRMTAELADGRHAELITDLDTLTRANPLRERLWEQLMVALDRSGRRAEALAAYARVRTLLADELGVDPGPGLKRVQRSILTGQQQPVPSQLPPDPPLFIGRDEQVIAVASWLGTDPVAITGPGGVGKTVLAIRVAHRTRGRFPDGQLYATVGPDRPTASVLTRLLAGLGIRPDTTSPAELAETLTDVLARRRVLIVLDDVHDESTVQPLLPVAGGCGLLMTSRKRLTGLQPLRRISLDVLPDDDGITLLRAVAGRPHPCEPEADERIVRLCDGLPLAIRLAGARLATRPNWTATDLAVRLADSLDRLDWLQLGDVGVRASISQSCTGLTDAHQRLLRGLGCLELPEFPAWVAAAILDLPAGRAERLLDDLVEIHLIEPAGNTLTGPRYRMHDLIHLVAAEHSPAPTGDRGVARVLSGWHALAAAADDQLGHWFGLDPEPAPIWRPAPDALATAARNPMRWFDEETTALTSAVHQAARDGHPAWPIAQRLSTYLELRGRYTEWHDVLTAGLRGADATADRQGQATMLGLLMQVEGIRDEHRSSLRYGALTVAAYFDLPAGEPVAPVTVEEPTVSAALLAARREGDALAVGFEASRLALAKRAAGEPADYLGLLEEARDAFTAGGAPLLELWTIKNVGLMYCRMRRFDDARACLSRAQTLIRELGEASMTDYGGGDLAGVAAAHGRLDLAERLATERLSHAWQADDRWSAGRALVTLGEIHAKRGDHRAAADTYEQALHLWRDLNSSRRVRQIEAALARLTG
ncbi:BTAD domain-containing putative transcriptional regulator [Kibdelosporangium persicum]|uniref:DNA-binding transcriptional activator of the SARP family n=1 Tax=Kibdelosporangium persicum TaxID=2698649 RepID=A0ABX2F9T8_9PSEU|nr:BTAD domain-containing putative transcriptional regulator [Kibdelosporangium persicum]NRN68047.1 DNA-binding transcriptional activator of the SARP family [Kibdelosporangium persicum]